jgi:hypothetical protein
MGSRGRKSAASLSVVAIDARRKRVQPRADAPAEVRDVVRNLVASCAPDHFKPSDWPLLESYARAILLERYAYEQLGGEPLGEDGKVSSWIVVAEKAGRQIVGVSARLRLSPQHRVDPKTIGRNAPDVLLHHHRRPWDDAS